MAEIVYLGHSCVRVRGRDGIVLVDPYERTAGLDMGRPTAHIVLVTNDAPDHNNLTPIKPMKDTLFVADGPGEYEVQNILIRGVRTAHNDGSGGKQGHNTVYVFHLDDVAFCHLGDLGHKLTSSQLDDLGNVDVLFVPVGNGAWTLKLDTLDEVISDLSPKMVVPLYNDQPQQGLEQPHLEPLEKFTHHRGLREWQAQDKVTVSVSSLPRDDEETQIVVMRPSA